jgi:hypothetical protein
VLLEGEILDGRMRAEALRKLRKEPQRNVSMTLKHLVS